MSDLTTWLRFIPTDLRVVVPVHFPTTFTRHERMPTVNALDAGIVAHEAADRIDALEECLREVVESHEAFLQMLVVNTAMAMRGEVELIDESAAIRNDAAIAKARAMLEEK